MKATPGCLPSRAPCTLTFYHTRVEDRLRPMASAENPRTSTESIFDQDLEAHGKTVDRAGPGSGAWLRTEDVLGATTDPFSPGSQRSFA